MTTTTKKEERGDFLCVGFLYILTYLLHNALFFFKENFLYVLFFSWPVAQMSFCSGIKETGFLEDSNPKAWFENFCYSEAKKEMGIANTEEDFE